MSFDSESAFEDHLREIIDSRITSENPGVYALKYKTIGDIVIVRDDPPPAIFFLEVKYYQKAKGRLGIGASSGAGVQPEILQRRPAYLESHLRWVIGSDTHNGDGYWLATSEKICHFVSGGCIGRKQNNIQLRFFRKCTSINENQLVEQLKKWLLDEQEISSDSQ